MIAGTDFNQIRKKIRENTDKTIVFTSSDDEMARKVLEKEQINVLLINQKGRKDKLRQRDSGFNQVLAKVAKKKNVSIGINFDEILAAQGEEKAEILARVSQNVELCKKNKLNMIITTKTPRDPYDLKALGLILRMPTEMTKNMEIVR